MPVEVAQPVLASRPVSKSSDLLQSSEISESMLRYGSAPAGRPETSVMPERRSGTSELEQASWLLVRAIQYLTYEQRAGKVTSVQANRKAIALLCVCVEKIADIERRVPAKMSLRAWLGNLRIN